MIYYVNNFVFFAGVIKYRLGYKSHIVTNAKPIQEFVGPES